MENQQIKIMIVEDDATLAREIKAFLEKWGYQAFAARDFEEIDRLYADRRPQLILMDINLPKYDGFYWCRKIRERSEVPILYISSRSGDGDKIQAYAQGGDDYVEKPFHLEVLRAKIEAVLRRTYQYRVKDRVWLGPELYFEQNSSTLFYQDREVDLTKSERRIMGRLAAASPETVTREELMIELWNTDEYVSDGTLTVLICRLRGKLEQVCGQDIIRTKKGRGYSVEAFETK